MKSAWILIGIVVFLALIVILPGCEAYNQAVKLDEAANNAWANVEAVLQRRYDLIPNLVNTVKGFAKQEQTVLTEVTRLRSQWGEAKTPVEKANTASMLEGALSRLMIVVERYPELKSNQNFLALQDELTGTENRISVERRRYNDAVMEYNRSIRRVPARFYVSAFGFQTRKPFEAAASAKEAPKVEF